MIALVTGGAHGIGAALTRRLLGRGDDVVVADVDPEGERGSLFVRTDVRSYEDNERLVTAVVERFGRLDIAVFNAGATGPRFFSVDGLPRRRADQPRRGRGRAWPRVPKC